jgi:hypothetical protein
VHIAAPALQTRKNGVLWTKEPEEPEDVGRFWTKFT